MKWTIRQIKEYPEDILSFDEVLHVKEALQLRDQTILDIEPVQVNGYVSANEMEIFLHCQVKAEITLPSSRSLKPVTQQLLIPIKERYVYPDFDTNIHDYEETTIVLEHDYIDLDLAVIDAILLNLPMQVVDPDEKAEDLPSGKNWTVITEDEYKMQQDEEAEEKVDSRFAGLQSLLNEMNDEE